MIYRTYIRVIDGVTKILWLILLIKWLVSDFEIETLLK